MSRFFFIKKSIFFFFSTGLGIGKLFFPISGTIGSIFSIPFCMYLSFLSWKKYLLITFIMTIFSIFCCHQVEKYSSIHDCKSIILDEFIGMLITFFPFSLSMYIENKRKYIYIHFILFRIFDIIKPWPIFLIDKEIPGGIGIVLDDMIAGIFSAIFASILFFLEKNFFYKLFLFF